MRSVSGVPRIVKRYLRLNAVHTYGFAKQHVVRAVAIEKGGSGVNQIDGLCRVRFPE